MACRSHTRRTCFRPSSPVGLTTRTMSRTAKRDRQAQLRGREADVLADQVEEDAEQEAADHRAGGALEPAEHRRGEGVDQDRLHHRRLEELRRLRHQAGDRAEHRGEAPADASIQFTRTPTSDAAAGRSAAARIASPSFVNWKSTQSSTTETIETTSDADVLPREGDAADVVDRVAERRLHELQVGAPDPRRRRRRSG